MSDSQDLILFWHRRDLRLEDSLGLSAAGDRGRVVGIFCFDPQILDGDGVAAVQVAYMLGCLVELRDAYAAAGSRLLFVRETPQMAIVKVANALGVKAVYWHDDVEPMALERDRSVAEALQAGGIEVCRFWDQVLHSPETVKTGNQQPYSVYTPYWKNWRGHLKDSPAKDVPFAKVNFTPRETAKIADLPTMELPTGRDLGYPYDEPLIFPPGTKAARKQLETFTDRAIHSYSNDRNFPAINGTSGLSAALRFGTIGIRTVWQATETAMAASRSTEAQAGVTTWQQELAWREFYQQALYHFPHLADGAHRKDFHYFPWDDRQDRFTAWCEGKTGFPIVDAAMRQLNSTGWMHNRCRMIVASFLTKDLILNWQWGEKYFMQTLIDGELAANNGGWQWSASSGMDPKPLRIFNPYTQAQKFDPDAEYIRTWLPELKSVETETILSGKISKNTSDRAGYPQPIVDHNTQQKEFKRRYQLIKAG
jgi:deoxyribodipyrimidine photo-lyase